MGDYVPIYKSGAALPATVGATALVGGNVVTLSAAGGPQTIGTVIPSTAASGLSIGVASTDAAVGTRTTILRGGVHELVASAAITALAPLKSAAGGQVTVMTIGTDPQDQLIGYALTAATAAGQLIRVLWVK